MSQEQNQTLDSHLQLIKALPEDKIDDEFYNFMTKSKQALGDLHPRMAVYYYEYANYILGKIQKNIDVFNADKMPANAAEAPALDQIEEDYLSEEDQSEQKAKSQKPEASEKKQAPSEGNEGNIQYEDEDIVIKGQAGQKKQQTLKENTEEQNVQVQQSNQQNGGAQQDQREICFYNLQCALKIFNEQKQLMENGQEICFTKEKLIDYLLKVHSRLGDLYLINQSYSEGVEEYRKVVEIAHTKPDWQKNRGLAETHYLIGNAFLYDNKLGCEEIAIGQYITSVTLLVAHMKDSISYTSNFQIPSKTNIKVNRLSYLPKPEDNAYVTDLKEVISCLLDKIQDTYQQISVRAALQQIKGKQKKESQKKQFKELPEGTQVKNLGTFGNRKKAPKQIQNQQPQQNSNNKHPE